MPPHDHPQILQKLDRDMSGQLNIIVVGAGLGGLGAAIALLLAGHNVTVLESASEIGEIGAGIQVLPNSSRILISWGLEDKVRKHITMPRYSTIYGWKGNYLGEMDFYLYERALRYPFWDFHRADLHRCLFERAVELGADVKVKSRVVDIQCAEDGLNATVILSNGSSMTADLVVGADGVSSTMRELLLGRPDPPVPTGDLAYRVMIDGKDMLADPATRDFIADPHVNYWFGPGAHAVNYVLRGGELFNMVLCVPDDIPGAAMRVEGSVEEMQALFKDWDPRIKKLLKLCRSVEKWKLCIRPTSEQWTHPSGTFTLLGDAVHATLPYLAAGCGMALEDAAVLGLCLSRIKDKSQEQKMKALRVYEACRRERTEKVVDKASHQQYVDHLPDGDEQRKRDQLFKKYEQLDLELMSEPNPQLERRLEGGDDPLPWRYHGVGCWLLTYDCEQDVRDRWTSDEAASARL